MSTQHTPGPWTLDGAANTGDLDIISPTGRIAMLDCEFSEASEDVLTADARLIAAAPDLLHALRVIDSNAAESPEWIRRVTRAAIAKAIGGGQ
jgi:hypothetical protein